MTNGVPWSGDELSSLMCLFCFEEYSRHVTIWREKNMRNKAENVRESHHYKSGGIVASSATLNADLYSDFLSLCQIA